MTNKKKVIENKAMLLGMILSGAKIEEETIVFSSTSEKIADYFNFILNKVYKRMGEKAEKETRATAFLHSYNIILENAYDILEDLEVNKNSDFKKNIVESQGLGSAYLSGAFLARGSVNDPSTSKYHFEITLDDAKNAILVQSIINQFDFNSKIIRRRNRLVIYIKDAEKIVDILRLMGATKNAFHFEDLRIERDFNNSINRVINCEVHNEEKALTAAREQLKIIKYLEYNYPLEKLDHKLITLMKVRKDNPEATLVELIEILQEEYGEKISKPGLSHRFAKLKTIATEHKAAKNDTTNF